ncbi:MAG: PfkB family carbohydrate kinase [Kiritimatiellia bacterium]|nr:PfkB family carbohydrate kinase [Kiritimatiellia bacterium]
MSVTVEQTRAWLRKFKKCRVSVVGDLMLDRYVYGTVERISPEAPVPVVRIREERDMPGGACNVAANIRDLGGQAGMCGWIGRDPAGRDLCRMLEGRGVDAAGVTRTSTARTTLKTRIIPERQQVVRVDTEDPVELISSSVHRRFLQGMLADIAISDGVVVEDYGKGVITQQVMDAALQAAAQRGIPVGFDPKDDHDIVPMGVTIATPNRREAFARAGRPDHGPGANPLKDEPLLEVGRRLMTLWRPEHLLITLGPMGMLLMTEGRSPHHVPTRAREVFDVSGAGDTVIAVVTLALAAGASGMEAAEIANFAAGVVVGKLGTATCSPDELLAFLRNHERTLH